MSARLGPWVVEVLFIGYKDVQGGFEVLWNFVAQGRQRNQGFFSGMLRGVSNPREGSKILFFLFRPPLDCGSLLYLRSSWKVNCANFRFTAFSEVRQERCNKYCN